MSCRTCDSEKLKKKSKKIKPRTSVKKTQKSLSSTKYSKDVVEPPLTIIKSIGLKSAGLQWNEEKPRECDPYADGDYSKMPHEAPNEVNFIGGIGANIGHRRSKKFINRTTKIQEIYNMRNDNKTIYNFCEDSRLTTNVPARRQINSEENDRTFVQETVRTIGAIKHEQLQSIERSHSSTDVEQIAEPNTNLNTNFEDDLLGKNKQRNLEIRKQFLTQKRILLKQHLDSQVTEELGFGHRKQKFKLSEYFDVDKKIPEDIDIESVREVIVDWTEKYKVEKHDCDLKFGRPMPTDVVPIPLEREKLSFLTRTLDKEKNIDQLNQEFQKYSKPIEEGVINDYPNREIARELEKILKKQRVENRSVEVALKDFDEFMKTAGVFDVIVPKEALIKPPDTSRQDQVNDAIKSFEEKILQKLSEPEDSNFLDNISDSLDESLKSKGNIRRYKEKRLSQEINLPIDFTHAFEVGQNKKVKDSKYPVYNGKIEKEKTNGNN